AGLDAADYLARNDAYHFFDPIGGLIKTGPTGTNVMDLGMIFVQ
ncbi:MAG TPA: MOFRL family protein, partial [Calditrichia bacterium]|nr:MOFRL family protein [Calditrichia bacterium]